MVARPFYAIPDFAGSPEDWQYNTSPDDSVLYDHQETSDYTIPLSTLDAEALESLEQGFNMLFIVTSVSEGWYHNSEWFAAL